MESSIFTPEAIDGHLEVIENHHRFAPRVYGTETWDFRHLEPYAFKAMLDLPQQTQVSVVVVVLFSCHCFSREPKSDELVPTEHLVDDGSRKKRMLDAERYALSKHFLPRLVQELACRHIKVSDPDRPNFVTFEPPTDLFPDERRPYSIFFEVVKDTRRKHRLLLRVQSAYLMERVSKQLQDARKMNFSVILKRAYTGRR